MMAGLIIHQMAEAIISISILLSACDSACTNGQCKLQEECSSDADCAVGLYCLSCNIFKGSRCVRSNATDPFKLLNNSLPYNKYAFLATHNSFAIEKEERRTGARVTLINQQHNITSQLNHGVRALKLDTYDFKGDLWLCHSFNGQCEDFTSFEPAIEALKEIEGFLAANPSEIITLILEDYVTIPNGLTKVFNESGLMKYWFPLSKMPQTGQDWPLVKDMVADNQRLIVFTSVKEKQQSEQIAYQWNFIVENQYGNDGLNGKLCTNRNESSALNDKTKSLVFINHFPTIPIKELACSANSANLMETLRSCYTASANRWANFIGVDYYKRSDGGGVFQALDMVNGQLLCGYNDVNACTPGLSITLP